MHRWAKSAREPDGDWQGNTDDPTAPRCHAGRAPLLRELLTVADPVPGAVIRVWPPVCHTRSSSRFGLRGPRFKLVGSLVHTDPLPLRLVARLPVTLLLIRALKVGLRALFQVWTHFQEESNTDGWCLRAADRGIAWIQLPDVPSFRQGSLGSGTAAP